MAAVLHHAVGGGRVRHRDLAVDHGTHVAGGGTPTSQEAVPVPSATSRTAAPGTVAGTGPVLRILPLGSGLVLIGLGFGLAFIALRMRQASG